MTTIVPPSGPTDRIAPPVVYSVQIHEPSPAGHWHAVDMIRSSGARFDTTLNRWTIALPADVEPLFAPGRIGEALLRGSITLTSQSDAETPQDSDRPRPTSAHHRRTRNRHRVRITTA